jgi:hypothetical protein
MQLSDTVRVMINQDGGILLEIKQGKMFGLNLVGSRVLEMLRRGCVETQISEEIRREFGVTKEVARVDVRELFESLTKNNLLQSNEP